MQVVKKTFLFLIQVGLAVVNGQLYAVGGFDGTTYLKNVETFDQEVQLSETYLAFI